MTNDRPMRRKLEEIMAGRNRDRAKPKPPHSAKSSVLNSARRCLMTTAIGAIARFEKAFGLLWGHGKDELSEDEEQWGDLWEECREEILDHVHEQIRILEDEIRSRPNT